MLIPIVRLHCVKPQLYLRPRGSFATLDCVVRSRFVGARGLCFARLVALIEGLGLAGARGRFGERGRQFRLMCSRVIHGVRLPTRKLRSFLSPVGARVLSLRARTGRSNSPRCAPRCCRAGGRAAASVFVCGGFAGVSLKELWSPGVMSLHWRLE